MLNTEDAVGPRVMGLYFVGYLPTQGPDSKIGTFLQMLFD